MLRASPPSHWILLSLFIVGRLASQSGDQTASMRVSIPSPTAASLGKFGDVPVSLYTGVPVISIPLFTAKGRTLELPISLQYHAGGIKVEDIGGWVGMGWTLEAGGVITRTVRGTVDERSNGYYYTGYNFYDPQNWPAPSNTFLYNVANRYVDGEPDQFFYNFAGTSGEFIIGPTSTDQSLKEVRMIPYQKWNVQLSFGSQGISSWVITTENGTRYTFSAKETHTDWSPRASFDAYGTAGAYASSWYLTEIRSPAGDVITLQYQSYNAAHDMGVYREQFDEIGGNACSLPYPWYDAPTQYEIASQRLLSITTAAHTVTFVTSLRSDATGPMDFPITSYRGLVQEPRLDTIIVATPSGQVIRRFAFNYDYTTLGNGRLALKNVFEQDPNRVSLPPYTFAYSPVQLPVRTSYAVDHWGFYNGQNTNTSYIPPGVSPLTQVSYGGAVRTPDAASMKAGVLIRITYPTGGYNDFAYEANDYGALGDGSSPYDDIPRSSSVSSTPFQGTQSTTFTVAGTQTVMATVTLSMYVHTQVTGCGNGDPVTPCPFGAIVGKGQWYAPGPPLQPGQQPTVTATVSLAPGTYTLQASSAGYNVDLTTQVVWKDHVAVTKKTAGGLRISLVNAVDGMGNTTVTKYFYTLQSDPTRSSGVMQTEPKYDFAYSGFVPDPFHVDKTCQFYSRSSTSKMPLGSGPVVGYSDVTVWHGTNGEYGQTRATFTTLADPALPANVWPYLRRTSYDWRRGEEASRAEYNASTQMQRRTLSTYSFPEPTQTTRKFRGMSTSLTGGGSTPQVLTWNAFLVESGWRYLDTETTTVCDTTGASCFSTTKTFVYANPNHIQLTELDETNSNGTQRITRMKYPADYATGSGNAEAIALTAMQGATNMHNPVIERWVSQKVGSTETVMQALITSFKTYAAGQYLPYQTFVFNNPSGVTNFTPSTVAGSFTKDSRYLLQETANTYDTYGRITQLTDPRGKVTNYLYGGNAALAFLTKVTRVHDPGAPVDLVTDLAYDGNGYLQSLKDEGGSFRYFTYDGYGRLRQIKNNASVVTRAYGYTYSRTSPNWTFNPVSPNAVIDTSFLQPTVTVVSTQYIDGLGRPIQSLQKDGTNYYITATQYDVMGRPWRVWKPYTRTQGVFDPNFSTNATAFYNTYLSVSNAKPYTETQYTPDALSRATRVTPEYAGTSPTAFVLTAYGVDATAKLQITQSTDESGNKTRTYFDIFANTVKSILGYGAPEATTTQFTYNVLGQRTQTTDPRSLNTAYTLDTRGLLSTRVNPDAGAVNYKYDKGGNLRFSQDANQAVLAQVYFTNFDFGGRPLTSGLGAATWASLDPDGPPTAIETTQANWLMVRAYDIKPPTTAFPWNAFSAQIGPLTLANVSGRLAAIASRSSGAWQVTLFSYDGDGQVVNRYTYAQDNGGVSVLTATNTSIAYTRDLRGAITQRSLVLPSVPGGSFYQWYDYDGRGMLWKLYGSNAPTKPASPDVTDTYRPSGVPQNYQLLGGPLVPITYTIREQTAMVGDPSLTTYPFSARYTYHPNGTILQAEFYSGGSPAAQKRYRYDFPMTGPFAYDALNRLKFADYTPWNGSGWAPTAAYDVTGISYDLAGNLTSLQRYRQDGTLVDNVTYSYPSSSNRLTSVTDPTATPETWDAETGFFTYDANGNVKTAPAPYSISAATYDAANLPLSITRSGTTTTYRYDDTGWRITKQVATGNTDVYLREGAAPLGVLTVNGSGGVVSFYFNLLWDNRVVGRQPSSGARVYYHFDALGSTRAVTQAATIVESHDYDPWGLEMPARGLGSGTKEAFGGKEQDVETGLDYFGARYYMPALGRWSAVDPALDGMPEWSPYNYVYDDPVLRTDPDGRQVELRRVTLGNDFVDQEVLGSLDVVSQLLTRLNEKIENIPLIGPLVRVVTGLAPDGSQLSNEDRVQSGAQAVLDAQAFLSVPEGRAPNPLSRTAPTEVVPPATRLSGDPAPPGPTIDQATGRPVGRLVVDSKGNTMIEPVGGSTVPAGRGGTDTHTTYPNGSNYQRLNPSGHPGNPTPHGHGHLPGTGPGKRGQGQSITPTGQPVPSNSPEAHWRVYY